MLSAMDSWTTAAAACYSDTRTCPARLRNFALRLTSSFSNVDEYNLIRDTADGAEATPVPKLQLRNAGEN